MVQEGILQLPCALELSAEAHALPLLLSTTTLLLIGHTWFRSDTSSVKCATWAMAGIVIGLGCSVLLTAY